MNEKSHFSKSLGPKGAILLEILSGAGKTIFTLDEATQAYGETRKKTIQQLSDLCAHNILARLKSGTYLILKMGLESTQLTNWPVIACHLAEPNTYFISHYSAMRTHGMTIYSPLDVYVTMFKRRRIRSIENIKYHFIHCKPENVWGVTHHWATKHDKVVVSDVERTILDALARPVLCGGIIEIAKSIWRMKNVINWERLTEYAKRYHQRAAIKRLGFILETQGIAKNHQEQLAKTISNTYDYISLDPNGFNEGKHYRRWRIRININIDELKASKLG